MHARVQEPLSTSFLFALLISCFSYLLKHSRVTIWHYEHQLWFGPVRYFKLLIWGQESFWLSLEFSYNHPSFISLHWRSNSWREIHEMGRRHFSKCGERLIGENDLKPLLNRKEPVNFGGNYFVARQGPQGNLWPKYFLVSGSGNDSTQMEFTMEDWMEWPHPSSQQRPLLLALFKYNERSPGSSGWLLFLFPRLLSLFHRGLPPLAGHLGLGWALIWQEKGRSTRWPTKLNCSASLALPLNNRPLCFEM